MVEAHSTSESVRGRLHRDQRPDFYLIDDFEANKTKDGKAYVDQAQKHIDELATSIAAEGAILYLGNFITELGVIERLMDHAEEDTRLIAHNVPVIEDGKPTWPAKYAVTDEEAARTGKVCLEDKKRQVGSVIFSAEMLNQPSGKETAVFKREWFRHRKHFPWSSLVALAGNPVRAIVARAPTCVRAVTLVLFHTRHLFTDHPTTLVAPCRVSVWTSDESPL